jgi:prephenate dehydrogenase
MIPVLRSLQTEAVITDIGSTKRRVMDVASGMETFVGGHPMAGSERTGADHAQADLFAGRPWLLVRGHASDRAARLIEGVARALGAAPTWLDADAHDRVVAYVSHLPQVIAVALTNAAREGAGDDGLAASGRAFSEMTRLASSPAAMWADILADNADFVTEALTRFAEHLPQAGDLLREEWVRTAFAHAAVARRLR